MPEMSMKLRVALLTLFLIPLAFTQEKPQPVDAEGHQWWQHAVFYEVYPRSFADSNNNGIGDLRGITSKLGYLHDLGVDAIWITPCFPSPQVDFGYDVSNYEDIDLMYGTLADFDVMVKDGEKKKVKVILDFVVNHTSDQHPWFLDSKSSKTANHRDWFIWRDGQAGGKPPNNWISIFGGPAWKFDPKTNQWYYHIFYAEQPDLNWRDPAVEKAMFDVTRWWYRRGVAGFRLDAVDRMFEDPDLRDNPVLSGTTEYGDPNTEAKYNAKLPEMHDELKGLRKVADQYNAVLIGETWTKNVAELKQYYGNGNDELQMPMDFLFTKVDKLSPAEFRRQIAGVEGSGGWPVFVLSNHDIVRAYNRYGDGTHNDEIAKLMAGFYLTLRGTPIMYYGEEIGMENNDPKSKDDVKDPIGRRGWPEEKGRDGERTPMQWNDKPNAGFSTATPWLPVPPSYKTHNVATESKDPDSILNFYKRVLALRHTTPALLDGNYVVLNESDDNVLSYLRSYKGQAVLVALNMSSSPQKVKFDLSGQGFANANFKSLAATPQSTSAGQEVSLPAFGVFIGEVTK
jgi:alpha-glucosidase